MLHSCPAKYARGAAVPLAFIQHDSGALPYVNAGRFIPGAQISFQVQKPAKAIST